jgi:Spy/CpxP family protein refolding chaperone
MSTVLKFPRPARLLIGGLVLATAGAFTLTASAQPHGGGPGGPGGHMMMMGGSMGGGLMMGGPHQMERRLDSVNATAEQRTQIRGILQAAMGDLRGQRASRTALHDQAAAIFTAPTVDARAAETLRQQMLAQHDQASKRMLQAMLDVSRVLTPEQRKALGERMAQRQTMMQRHRAERDALEKR